MNDIMKIAQALEDSGILLKGVTKIIRNETKEQKVIITIFNYVITMLLGNLLTGKGTVRAGEGTVGAGERI